MAGKRLPDTLVKLVRTYEDRVCSFYKCPHSTPAKRIKGKGRGGVWTKRYNNPQPVDQFDWRSDEMGYTLQCATCREVGADRQQLVRDEWPEETAERSRICNADLQERHPGYACMRSRQHYYRQTPEEKLAHNKRIHKVYYAKLKADPVKYRAKLDRDNRNKRIRLAKQAEVKP
jgi:hypothetical protein